MEAGVRKLLPRVQAPTPTPPEQSAPTAPEPAVRNGIRPAEAAQDALSNPAWRSPLEEETGQKRKRQRIEDRHPNTTPTTTNANIHALPSVRHLLPGGSQAPAPAPASIHAVETERSGHARLIRVAKDAYIHEGPYKFRAPPPQRDFPTSVSEDARPLGFAVVEPELMDVFRRAWYLRQYIRLKRMRNESWLDHIFFNDCFGVENALYTWTSRYEPGMVQYPASVLYKHCLWLFFNRSVQASQPSPAYAQVVEDGLHFVRGIENALGQTGDRSILLVPLFLLGASAFYADQRRDVWEALDRLDPSYNNDSVNHAAKTLERLWGMMDDGRVMSTWEWEKYQAHEYIAAARDRSLVDFLIDPLAPLLQPAPVRSPETHDFDASRFRAVQSQPPSYPQISAPAAPPPPPPPAAPPSLPPQVAEPPRSQHDADMYTPPHARSPPRTLSAIPVDAPDSRRVDGIADAHPNHQADSASAPRPFLAPPPPPPPPLQTTNFQPNNDVIQVMHRKATKTKSSVPPCPACGKELKNPSDAQKHQLQHSKPFRCREPGCTRAQGFATENDLQRHRKSVHGASPRIGNKIGYVCAACPEPSDGTTRKWWPRLDNFKAHIRRKHQEQDEEALINSSASANKPGDGGYPEAMYYSSASNSLRWPEDREHVQSLRRAAEGSGYDYQYDHDHGHESSYEVARQDSQDGEEDGIHHSHAEHEDSDGDDDIDGVGADSQSAKSESEEGSNPDAMDVSPTTNDEKDEKMEVKVSQGVEAPVA